MPAVTPTTAGSFHGVVMFLGNPPTWTDARVELAKQLFEDGATASQAAMKLGGISRNAIIGKWHRMGLVRTPKQRSLMRARKPITRKEKIAKTPKRLPPTFFAEPLPQPVETDIARVSLMDLERHHCRFPVGDPKDPTFGFCGCQPYPGLPYCEAHARRAYTPATLRSEPGPSFNVSIRNRTPSRELVDA